MQMSWGLQTFSLRHLAIKPALDRIAEYGIRNVEAHWPLDEMVIADVPRLLRERGLTAVAWGVPAITLDYIYDRAIMEYADLLGVKAVFVDPQPGTLPLMQRLAEEFELPIGIHPHGPGQRWQGWTDVYAVLQDNPGKVGICMDLGHVHRSGDDIDVGLRLMAGRIHGVHVKDVDAAGRDVPLGTGILPLRLWFPAMAQVPVIAIEYEGPEPDAGLEQSIAWMRENAFLDLGDIGAAVSL